MIQVPLKRIAALQYGDALSLEDRVPGRHPVMGSNGPFGEHNKANFAGPCIVVGRKGSQGKVAWVDEAPWVTDTAYAIDQRHTAANLRWVYWLLQTLDLESGSVDTGVPGLSREWAHSRQVLLPANKEQAATSDFFPSRETQARVADFLDRETQRIDSAICGLRQLVGLASEREFSVISGAIGGASEGMIRLSLVATLGTGHTPDRTKPEYWEDCTIPWVTAADLSGRLDPHAPLLETAQHISELGVANSAAVVHPVGTVMLCRTASVGLVCRIGVPMATTQAFVTWTPGPRLDSEYLMYCLVAMRDEWSRLKFGSTHDTIYFPDIQSIKIPYASLEAQRKAVGEIRAAVEKARELRQRAAELIDLLEERRRSVISEAVIGQLNVEALA